MKYLNFLLLILILSLTSGCFSNRKPVVQIPEPLEEVQIATPPAKEPGSLWTNHQSSMFSDRKAQNVGDIVTVIIDESASANKSATTTTGRESSMTAGIPTLFGIEDNSIYEKNGINFANLVSANFENDFEGNGTTTRSDKLTASLATQVVGRYPNGQLKIRGGKEVMVNNEVQIIYLTGIIRPVDITAANTVNSDKILNARISYTGDGVLSDKQEPGWLMRSLDNLWPF